MTGERARAPYPHGRIKAISEPPSDARRTTPTPTKNPSVIAKVSRVTYLPPQESLVMPTQPASQSTAAQSNPTPSQTCAAD